MKETPRSNPLVPADIAMPVLEWKIFKIISVVCLILVFSTSCGNSRVDKVNSACDQVANAWAIYSLIFKKEIKDYSYSDDYERILNTANELIPLSRENLIEAATIFRELSADNSAFIELSKKAFFLSKVDAELWANNGQYGFGNQMSELINFCGIDLENYFD
jgi:hypothetical protein